MKKRLRLICISIIAVLACVWLTACALSPSAADDTEYTIMYATDGGTQTINVKHGDVYSMRELPSKYGYDFAGLFDAQEGGTQYVSGDGVCVTPFYDDKNIVLYVRFAPKKVDIRLHYGKAASTGVTELSGEFDGEIPALPAALTIPDKDYMVFKGWYTSEYGFGTAVAGADGSALCKLDRELLSDDFRLDLYAVFERKKYTVTFKTASGAVIAEKTVEHGANLKALAENVTDRGIPVKNWAWTSGGSNVNFDGLTAESDAEYYVSEYASTARVTYKNYDETVINTAALKDNYADTVSVKALCGRTVAEFAELGYIKVRFGLTVTISEKDDGYQEVFISKTRVGSSGGSYSDCLWYEKNIEHSPGKKDTSLRDYTFTTGEFDVSAIPETLYVLYSAHGSGGNGWYRHRIVFDMDFIKP